MGDLHLANEFNTHFVNIGSTKDQASSKMNNGNKCSTDAKFTFSEMKFLMKSILSHVKKQVDWTMFLLNF